MDLSYCLVSFYFSEGFLYYFGRAEKQTNRFSLFWSVNILISTSFLKTVLLNIESLVGSHFHSAFLLCHPTAFWTLGLLMKSKLLAYWRFLEYDKLFVDTFKILFVFVFQPFDHDLSSCRSFLVHLIWSLLSLLGI